MDADLRKKYNGLSNEISILTGVVLPLYSIGFTQFTTWISLKKSKRAYLCSADFALATVSSVVLGIFYSSGAGGFCCTFGIGYRLYARG